MDLQSPQATLVRIQEIKKQEIQERLRDFNAFRL